MVRAQEEIAEFQTEVDKLAKKRGIDKLKHEVEESKRDLTNYMARNRMSRLDLDEAGYVNCIQSTAEHVWILSKSEIPVDAPDGMKPLRTLLSREAFMRVTKRVIDKDALDEAVADGDIDEKEIAAAHFTRMRAPYIRFESGPK